MRLSLSIFGPEGPPEILFLERITSSFCCSSITLSLNGRVEKAFPRSLFRFEALCFHREPSVRPAHGPTRAASGGMSSTIPELEPPAACRLSLSDRRTWCHTQTQQRRRPSFPAAVRTASTWLLADIARHVSLYCGGQLCGVFLGAARRNEVVALRTAISQLEVLGRIFATSRSTTR